MSTLQWFTGLNLGCINRARYGTMTQTCSLFVQKQFVPSAAALRGKKNSLKLHISRTLTIHTFPFSFAGISLSVFLDVSCFCDSNLRQWIGNCSEWANKYSVCVGNTGSCNYPKWNSVCESVCCIAAEQTDIKSVCLWAVIIFFIEGGTFLLTTATVTMATEHIKKCRQLQNH